MPPSALEPLQSMATEYEVAPTGGLGLPELAKISTSAWELARRSQPPVIDCAHGVMLVTLRVVIAGTVGCTTSGRDAVRASNRGALVVNGYRATYGRKICAPPMTG